MVNYFHCSPTPHCSFKRIANRFDQTGRPYKAQEHSFKMTLNNGDTIRVIDPENLQTATAGVTNVIFIQQDASILNAGLSDNNIIWSNND